jgi:hypothetical protein
LSSEPIDTNILQQSCALLRFENENLHVKYLEGQLGFFTHLHSMQSHHQNHQSEACLQFCIRVSHYLQNQKETENGKKTIFIYTNIFFFAHFK